MKITALGLAVLMILAVMALLPTAMAQEVPAHVVMSEVFYDESGDDNNEFCELYNPTDSDIDISGWKLKAFNQPDWYTQNHHYFTRGYDHHCS